MSRIDYVTLPTGSVILSDPPCKYSNAQNWHLKFELVLMFIVKKLFSIMVSIQKWLAGNRNELSECNTFKPIKTISHLLPY